MPSIATGKARVVVMAISVLLVGGAGWWSRVVSSAELSAARPSKSRPRSIFLPAAHRDAASLSPEEILGLPDPTHRLEELTDRALAIPCEEIPVALAALSAPLLDSVYAEILVRRWAERSPEQAMAWTGGLSSETAKQHLRLVAISAWAGEEMAAAHEWVLACAEAGERPSMLLEVARAGVDAEPVAALGIAAGLRSSPARDELMVVCLRAWSDSAPEAATAWVLALPEAMTRQVAVAEVATTVASRDPAMATDLALDHIADDEVFAGAILGIVSRASGGNPERIREWIDRFPEGPLKHAARAEFTRIERGLLRSVKSLPGEDIEDRSPRVSP